MSQHPVRYESLRCLFRLIPGPLILGLSGHHILPMVVTWVFNADWVGHAFINVRSHMTFTAVNYILHCIPGAIFSLRC